MAEHEKLASAVGRTSKTIRTRAGLTLDDVAHFARKSGLKWSTARVVEFENGKIPLTLGTLLVVASALAVGAPEDGIRLADLLPDSGEFEVTPQLIADGQELKAALRGGSVLMLAPTHEAELQEQAQAAMSAFRGAKSLAPSTGTSVVAKIEIANGTAEQRAAKSLGLDMAEFSAVQAACWGRTLSAERSARAPAGANPQTLGRITRELKAELSAHLDSLPRGRNGVD